MSAVYPSSESRQQNNYFPVKIAADRKISALRLTKAMLIQSANMRSKTLIMTKHHEQNVPKSKSLFTRQQCQKLNKSRNARSPNSNTRKTTSGLKGTGHATPCQGGPQTPRRRAVRRKGRPRGGVPAEIAAPTGRPANAGDRPRARPSGHRARRRRRPERPSSPAAVGCRRRPGPHACDLPTRPRCAHAASRRHR